ncbi:magnesium and cobalt transport protein CorA [Dietzia sp.]|uniref:magnesium and cobalt transport protein CorA n=1 Tax=Dietzia sp. TaxID=1871616 RepID=UPI002FDA0D3B
MSSSSSPSGSSSSSSNSPSSSQGLGLERLVPGLGRHGNTSGGNTKPPQPVDPRKAVVDCGVYVDGRRVEGEDDYSTALDYVRDSGKGFVWIGVHAPSQEQMRDIARCFGLHELIAEDAVMGGQRPKLERYEDLIVLNLRTVDYREHDSVQDAKEIVATGDILVICAEDFVMTVRHGDFGGLTDLRQSMESRPELLELGPSSVAHAVADHIVDAYIDVTHEVEFDVEELESAVFDPEETLEIEHIYLLKREVLELKHTVVPLSMPLRRLSFDQFDVVDEQIRHYFRDVLDHNTQVSEEVVGYDERLTSLVSAAIARAGNKQNQDMRRISAWVAIAAVPTLIAGIFGMNFDNMPELHLESGYYLALGLMLAVCVFLYFLFRRNDWL